MSTAISDELRELIRAWVIRLAAENVVEVAAQAESDELDNLVNQIASDEELARSLSLAQDKRNAQIAADEELARYFSLEKARRDAQIASDEELARSFSLEKARRDAQIAADEELARSLFDAKVHQVIRQAVIDH